MLADTLKVAREEIIQERQDVDKDFEALQRNEKKLNRIQKETNELKAELEKQLEKLAADNKVCSFMFNYCIL